MSEGPVAVLPRLRAASVAGLLPSVEALSRILRRVEALVFCGGVCAVLTFLRDKSRAPAAILVRALNTFMSDYRRLAHRVCLQGLRLNYSIQFVPVAIPLFVAELGIGQTTRARKTGSYCPRNVR